MKNYGASAIGLALTLLLPACGSGGSSDSGGGGGPLFIETCSLGCSNGTGGSQVTCTIVSVAQNREIDVFFSAPIDPASLSSTSFQLIELPAGQAPVGSRFVDSTDRTKVVFRPAVTFDSQGNVSYGFTPNTTYRVTIPGTAHNDPGPFIRSTGGGLNASRMQCDIHTTNQVDDPVAGAPIADIRVDLAIPSTPDVNDFVADQEGNGAVDVWRNSNILFTFNDIMNPVTLINPATGQSSLITVEVDSDGDLLTTTDRVTLFGTYTINIDVLHLRTTMLFVPANGMPSAGNVVPPALPRKVVVTIPPGVQDLVGNGVANAGEMSFTPELIQYDPVVLPDADGENFVTTANEDIANSGAAWGSGKLAQGWGGGSGRLGALHVDALETMTLDTDGMVFKNLSASDPSTTLPIVATSGLIDNSRPTGVPAGYNPADSLTWPTATVKDGIFEFSSITIEAGGTLALVGVKPPRVFSRGPVTINGTIDARGESAAAWSSDSALGGPFGAGGPNAGHGGDGGDRPDNTGNLDILFDITNGGIENPGAITFGGRGAGVGRVGSLAAGKGGINNPNPFPTSLRPVEPDRGGSIYSDIDGFGTSDCTIMQVASPGGGGAYGVSGGSAVPMTPIENGINPHPPPPEVTNLAVAARGGDAADLGIEPPDPPSGHVIRKLEAPRNLRGGSGGGGGGASLFKTLQQGVVPNDDCYLSFFAGITDYYDHSAAGGGGGGGAVQLVSGALIDLAGSILANGGDGGGNINDVLNERGSRASPGGGGSGGAVRLQATLVNIDYSLSSPSHINVAGGLGGVNTSPDDNGGTLSIGHGGDGGSGLVRLEDLSGGTTPPATLMTRCSEAMKILPFDPTHIDPNTLSGPCVGLPESEMLLSVGPWSPPTRRPETFSGAVSCWMRPAGNFFTLGFTADDLAASPPTYGWNMDVVYHDPVSGNDVLTPYRGRDANTPFSTGDFESNLGSAVNYQNEIDPPGNQFGTGPYIVAPSGTYLSVRFQGAVATSDISGDPCDVILSGGSSQIGGGSLTPWVRHPEELNQFLLRPNMIRFCVVFDSSLATPGSIPANIRGVTNLRIEAQPD
ncbi:MAG TPA: Ig-like domain-containing protein [Planctomycetota bacterium]|jgi:hypothetical protein|nr:Ig-like domain-containing protein [Planctomycetota bacterium]